MSSTRESDASVPVSSAFSQELEARLGSVGQDLGRSLRNVLSALPGNPHRPARLCSTLGINKDLSGRLLRATRDLDPVSTLHRMPGPEALRLVLRAARRRVPAKLIEAAEGAVGQYEDLVRRLAGDRIALDAIISNWVPQARARFELTNKQLAFKGMANLKGFSADVTAYTVFEAPSSKPNHVDVLTIQGFIGLKRLRPGALVRLSNTFGAPDLEGVRYTTLDGTPIEEAAEGGLLTEFCSSPMPRLEVHPAGTRLLYMLLDEKVGLESAVNLFLADLVTCYPLPLPGRRKTGIGAVVEVPSRVLLFDVLVHQDVRGDVAPELFMYDTIVLGTANPNDPNRNADRLNLAETIEYLGRSVSICRSDEVPGHVDVLRKACAQRGWDPDAFRVYRCRIQYPLHGTQVSMAFASGSGA